MAFWSRWFTKAADDAVPADGAAEPDVPQVPMPTPPVPASPAATMPATIGNALARLTAALPGVPFALNPPASVEQLELAEGELGFALPTDVRELYLTHDGQPDGAPGLFGGMPFLSLEDALSDWRVWASMADEYANEIDAVSYTADAVREVYINLGWFPLSLDGGGNNLGVDCDPGPAGVRGQVINFGRDEELKYVYAPSVTAFLTRIAELAEAGRAVVEEDDGTVFWGIDDAQSQWPRYDDFRPDERDAGADQAWFATLEPAWQERIGGAEQVTRFLTATSFSSFARDTVLPGVTSLEPLGRATNLRSVLIHTRVLEDLHALPALPLLTKLIVSTRSHAGIDRFPRLAEYVVVKPAPPADLGPLASAPNLTSLRLLLPHPDLEPLQRCARLTTLAVRLERADQLSQIAGIISLRDLTLDCRDVTEPVDGLDWSGLRGLRRLSLQLGTAQSLDFLDQLPELTELTIADPVGVDVGAVGRMPRVESVKFSGASGLVNVAAVAGATTMRHFSGGFAAFDVLKDLRPDLPFTSMEGRLTPEERQVWSDWLDARRPSRG